MKKLTLNLTNTKYDILVEDNILDKLDEYVYDVYKNKHVYIITDSNVAPLYLGRKISW